MTSPFGTSSLNYYYADHLLSKDKKYSSEFPKHFARLVEAALTQGQTRLGAFESNKVTMQAKVDNQQYD